jgi:two-component system alkaline phosphatase synthesis response regulator PhoP
MKRVLVVEDEPDMVELVRYNLEKSGFKVEAAADGERGLELARRSLPDAIVLDLMLPGVDGLEVLRRLKAQPKTASTPVILLTAKDGEADRVVGLELGADDYVVKPFSPRELVARVKVVLRRVSRAAEPVPVISAGPIVIDCGKREVTVEGAPAPLTSTEFELLRYLAERPGRALKRNELIDGALGEDAVVTDRVIDAHIAAVRRKLGEKGAAYIETMRGYGYRFRERAG